MHPNLIEHIQKFVSLSDADIETVLQHVKPMDVKKKALLLKEGQICKAMYFVEKGCLRMFFISDKGTEQITHFAIENWWLSDYGSFESQRPSQFFLQAVELSSLFYINHSEFETLLLAVPQLERYFRIIFQKANAASQLRIKYLYDFSKEERYHHFSGSYPQFVQRIPQYMLASYLGFTPEYLSEIRKNKR